MLSITVKTLDSQTRQFDVPDSIKVKDFKQKISTSINIPANQQRLIFQGRVLKDDHILTKEIYNGKTLHLVKNNPPSRGPPTSGATASQNEASGNADRSGNFNPAQLSQLVFQQAMGGISNLFGGNASNRNSQGNVGGIAGVSPGVNVRFSVNANNSQANQGNVRQPTPHAPSSQHQNTAECSLMQQFRHVDRIMNKLNEILDRLENGRSENSTNNNPCPDVNEDGNVQARDANINQAPSANSTTANNASQTTSTQTQTNSNHPRTSDLGDYFRRMLEIERRMAPYLNRCVEFFNTDPAFTSTQSEEYRSTAQWLTATLECQHLLSEVKRVLSNFSVSLSQTPPRSLSFNMPSGHHHHHQVPPRNAQNFGPRPMMNQPPPSFIRPQFPSGMPPPRMGAVAQGVHMRVRIPNPANAANQSSGNAQPRPTPTSANSNQQHRPTPTPSSQTGQQQPNVSIVVNATIQPRVDIVVERRPNSDQNPSTDATAVPEHSYATQQNAESAPPDNQAPPQEDVPVLPLIPGVPQDFLSNLFQSVAASLQQQATGSQEPVGPGRIIVDGPPGGPNQMVDDISSIISQAVTHAMQNQMPGSTSTTETGQTTQSSTSFSSTSSTVQTSTVTTNIASPASPDAASILSGGNFGVRVSVNQSAPETVQQSTADNAPNISSPGAMLHHVMHMLRGASSDQLQTPVNQFLSSWGFDLTPDEEDTGILYRIVHALGSQLSLVDMLNFCQSNPPRLDNVRELIQSLLREHCFNGATPTKEQTEEYAKSSAETYREMVVDLLSESVFNSDTDPVQSNINVLVHVIEKLFTIVFFTDASNFSAELNDHLRYSIALAMALNESLLTGGRSELVKLFQKFVTEEMSTDETTLQAAEMLYSAMNANANPYDSIVSSMASLCTVDQNTIAQFIARQPETPLQTSQSKSSEETQPSEVDMTSEDDSHFTPTTSRTSENETESMACDSESGTASQDGVGDWQACVPQEWIETIAADGEVQRAARNQSPFSEAYKAGMHGRKA